METSAALAALLAISASLPTGGAWTRHGDISPQVPPAALLWEARVTAREDGSGGDLLLLGRWLVHVGDSQVTALDAATGRQVWQSGAPSGGVLEKGVQAGTRLYVLSEDSEVFELAWPANFPAATPAWRRVATPRGFQIADLVAGEGLLLLVGYMGEGLVAFDQAGDQVRWQHSVGAGEIVIPALLPGGVIHLTVQGIRSGTIQELGLAAADGRMLFGPTPLNGVPVLSGTDASTALFASDGADGRRIWRMDPRTGRTLWSWTPEAALGDGPLHAGFGPGNVVWSVTSAVMRIDAATGRPGSLYPLPGDAPHLLMRAAPDHLLLMKDGASLSGDAPSEPSYVVRLDVATGGVTSARVLPAGATLASFQLIPNGFVVLTTDGRLRAFRG